MRSKTPADEEQTPTASGEPGVFRAPSTLLRTPGSPEEDSLVQSEDVPLSTKEDSLEQPFEMPNPTSHSTIHNIMDDDMMRELTQTPRAVAADGILTVDEWLVTSGGFGKFQVSFAAVPIGADAGCCSIGKLSCWDSWCTA